MDFLLGLCRDRDWLPLELTCLIERLWRSLKYESLYLNVFETGSEARNGIGAWITYYNFASLRPSFYVVEGKRFC